MNITHNQAHILELKFNRLHIPACLRYIGHVFIGIFRFLLNAFLRHEQKCAPAVCHSNSSIDTHHL